MAGPLDELLAYLPSEVERFLVRGALVELELAALLRYHREFGLVDLVELQPSAPAARKLSRVVPGARSRPGRAR